MTDLRKQLITIFHSPDADDAFMFYGLSSGQITHSDYEFSHELCDIQSLNQKTVRGELDVTAVSVHALAYLKDQYAVLNCGASMGGKDYGPRLVSKPGVKLSEIKSIATPGDLTSATLAMRLYCAEQSLEVELINMDFDKVQDEVKAGNIDAGIIIHEGQITSHKLGLNTILDLGQWWWENNNLPLPLGVNVVRKSLGQAAMKATAKVLHQSISYSLKHREEALKYALEYGRGISLDEADKFVGMYVNDLTLDLGESGKKSIKLFLNQADKLGFIPSGIEVEFV